MKKAADLDLAPSSFSTLWFEPDWITRHLPDEQKDEKPVTQQSNNNESDDEMNTLSFQSNPYQTRSKTATDSQTLAFVALRDIIKVSMNELMSLYSYNKMSFECFVQTIKKKECKVWCIYMLSLLHFGCILQLIDQRELP